MVFPPRPTAIHVFPFHIALLAVVVNTCAEFTEGVQVIPSSVLYAILVVSDARPPSASVVFLGKVILFGNSKFDSKS